MALRITVGRSAQTCDIPGCGRSGSFLVGRPDSTRVVCGRCMEELVTVSGWRVLGPIAQGSTAVPDDVSFDAG